MNDFDRKWQRTMRRNELAFNAVAAALADNRHTLTVAQQLLERYEGVCLALKHYRKIHDQLRRQLIELNFAGVPVEPGRLSFEVRTTYVQHLSELALRGTFSEEDVDMLKEEVIPTVVRIVKVGALAS
jgi:hypothetical protein